MENNISAASKVLVVKQNLDLWRNTLYDGQLNVRVGTLIEDSTMKERAVTQVKRSLQAIEMLEAELASLEKSTTDENKS